MLDQIVIENLETYGYHGVFAKENKDGQTFIFNVVLYTDASKAAKEDNLELSTDYGEVSHFINNWMEKNVCKLIETVAETLAKEILKRFPRVEAIDLEVKKPEAPIGLPFDSVSVKIHRAWHTAYLSIGSNMGEREKYLAEAVRKLEEHDLTKEVKISNWIETKPYGPVPQGDFLNGVVELKTQMSPQDLLEFLHQLEAEAGRERVIHWGPRTLDLDIIFYDKLVYEDDQLIIPHVDMENRYFVLKPLSELAPNLRHPILGKTVSTLLNELGKAEENEHTDR